MNLMGESLNAAKDALGKVIENLRTGQFGGASKNEVRDFILRLQFSQNALVQNEKKIWLRTETGKEMIGEFSDVSEKLLEVTESGSSLEEFEAALEGVEHQAKKLNEESRKRSMVVT